MGPPPSLIALLCHTSFWLFVRKLMLCCTYFMWPICMREARSAAQCLNVRTPQPVVRRHSPVFDRCTCSLLIRSSLLSRRWSMHTSFWLFANNTWNWLFANSSYAILRMWPICVGQYICLFSYIYLCTSCICVCMYIGIPITALYLFSADVCNLRLHLVHIRILGAFNSQQ